jgi:hypothetical protein
MDSNGEKTSEQKRRSSSSSPACLEGSKEGLTRVTDAKAGEVRMLDNARLLTQRSPASTVEQGDPLDQVLPMGNILLPPFIRGD